jgi:hypothetical protein
MAVDASALISAAEEAACWRETTAGAMLVFQLHGTEIRSWFKGTAGQRERLNLYLHHRCRCQTWTAGASGQQQRQAEEAQCPLLSTPSEVKWLNLSGRIDVNKITTATQQDDNKHLLAHHHHRTQLAA